MARTNGAGPATDDAVNGARDFATGEQQRSFKPKPDDFASGHGSALVRYDAARLDFPDFLRRAP